MRSWSCISKSASPRAAAGVSGWSFWRPSLARPRRAPAPRSDEFGNGTRLTFWGIWTPKGPWPKICRSRRGSGKRWNALRMRGVFFCWGQNLRSSFHDEPGWPCSPAQGGTGTFIPASISVGRCPGPAQSQWFGAKPKPRRP